MLEMVFKVVDMRFVVVLGIEFSGGIYGLLYDFGLVLEMLIEVFYVLFLEFEMDVRVRVCVVFMNKSSSFYEELLGNLKVEIFLLVSCILYFFK